MMLKQELIHSHILVAMLCGWEPQKPDKEYPNGYLWMQEMDDKGGDPIDYFVSNDDILEQLPYTTDWNYLMVAYGLFRDKAEEATYGEGSNTLMGIRDTLMGAVLDVNIDLAFKELVRGVNELNQLKLKEDE